MPESNVAHVMSQVAAHRRLMAALYERALIDAAVDLAAARIAHGYSSEAAVKYEARIERLKAATWGNA